MAEVMAKTVEEPARKIPVYDECDVLVVGAGPAGVAAAVAAAKNISGRVVLMERYACLGGMATGGQVLAIPFLSDGGEILVSGVMDELIWRLRRRPGSVFGPEKSEAGSRDESALAKYRHHGIFGVESVRYGVNVDPEALKIVLSELVEDCGVTVYCHCWACRAVVEGGEVRGVVFESKEGRKAVLAKVVVDCTGDGDIFASAGAEFETSSFSTSRTSNTALVFRLGGVDYDRYARSLRENHPDPHGGAYSLKELEEAAGFKLRPFSSHRNDVVWVNNWIPADCMTIRGLTDTAHMVMRSIEKVIDYLRGHFPGMENAWLYDIASQVGTRGSRRLKGVFRLTSEHVARRTGRDDIVAITPTLSGAEEYPRIEFPYGVLVPEKIDGLLAAGRCFSSDEEANEAASWIPHCVALGEAAGTAAAIALETGARPRDIAVCKLRRALKAQGVYL